MLEINKNFYSISVLDKDLKIFDIVMTTQYGSSYNSYLLKTQKYNVVFDGVKKQFEQEWLDNIEKTVGIKNVNILVVHHTEPDHSGSIQKLLELNPNITIYASIMAINFLKEITNLEFKSVVCNDTTLIDCGDEQIKFISAPNLHWPDTMFTYLVNKNVLLTCDAFGSHYCFEKMFISKMDDNEFEVYKNELKKYYDCIVRPFNNFVQMNLKKVLALNLNVKMICPSHGPIFDDAKKIAFILETYDKWSKPIIIKNKVSIIYVSSYGFTKAIANAIEQEFLNNNFEVKMYDLVLNNNIENIMKDIEDSKIVLFGSPTITGDALEPVWEVVNHLNTFIHKDKIVSAFGSYGWSGEAIKNLTTRFNQLRLKVVDPIAIKFKPSDKQLLEVKQYCQNLLKK